MTLAVSIPVSIFIIFKFFIDGMTLGGISLIQLPLFYFGIVAFSAIFAFLISFAMRFCGIEIRHGELIGRNYWGWKKHIPISAISKLIPFNHSGIQAVIADAGNFGEVYIYKHTENFEELIQHIRQNMGGENA